ncbi:MAG: immunoglobulin-like domain-containing protein, partial [Burkholderiales bacterium]
MAEANTSGAQQAQDAQNFDNQNSLSQPGSDAGASPGGRGGGSDGPAPADNPGTPDSPAMYSQTTMPGGVEQGGQGGPSNNDAGANGSGGSNAGRPQGSQTDSGNNGWTFSVNANSTGNQGNGQGDGAGAGGGDSGSGAGGPGSGGSGQGSAPQFNGVPGGGRGGSGGGGSSSGSGGSSNSGSTYTASTGGGDGPSQTGGNSSAGDGGGNQGDASGAGNSGSGSGASGNSGSASGNSSSGSTNSQSGTTGSNSGASGTGSSGTNNASSTGSSTGSSSTSSSTTSSSSSNSSSSSVASSSTTNSTGGQLGSDPYVPADLLNTSSGGVSLGGGAPKLSASAISAVTELSGATNSSSASVSGAVVTLKLFDANPNPSDTITITLASNPFTWSHGDLPATAAAQLAAALDLDNPSAQVFAVDSVTVSDAVDPVSGAIGKDITTALLFQVPDKTFDFLALGERLTINFQIVATETATGVAAPPQDFSIFVTGTNDVPVISAVQHTGATDAETLTKVIANGHLARVTDEASGTLTFTDVDLTDTHTVQIADPVVSLSPGAASLPADVASALKSALTIKMLDSTGVDVGTLNWSFSLDNTKLAFLTKNQTMKLVYDVTVTDSTHGVSVAHPVTLTILGASDDAVVTLSATPTVTQGAGIVYTADIGQNPTLSPIIVKLDNEYSITIPVGSTHASITVDAPTDVTSGAPVLETVQIAGLVGDGGFGKLTADTHAVTTLVTQVDDTPVVTIHAASSLNLTEGGFSAGQALFDYTVSADTDGSTMSEVVSDNIAGVHQAYFALSEGQVVLTTAGARYFNSHEAADLQSVQVTVTATDDAGEGGNESQ